MADQGQPAQARRCATRARTAKKPRASAVSVAVPAAVLPAMLADADNELATVALAEASAIASVAEAEAEERQRREAADNVHATGPPCVLLQLPREIWDVVAAQGLTARDLAHVSLASRFFYSVSHSITVMPRTVRGMIEDTLPPHLTPKASRNHYFGNCADNQLLQQWCPPALNEACVKAWPHLVFWHHHGT